MERQFFSGNTVEQAVLAAARHYGLDPDRVAYTLRDKKTGFVNIRRRVVIEVDPAAPEHPEGVPAPVEESPAPPVPSAAAPRAPRPSGRPDRRWSEGRVEARWSGTDVYWEEDDAPDQDLAAIESSLAEIVALLDLELEVSIVRQEERIEVELSGVDSEALVDRDGALLDAIEHLLPRMVRGLAGHPVPCRLDSGGFRAAHRESMRELAEEAADAVRHEGQSRLLAPMSPADRRLVHMALADDPAVETESEGDGFMKRVRISPV